MKYKAKVTRVQEQVFYFDETEIRPGENPEDVAFDIALNSGDWTTVDDYLDYVIED